MVVMVIIVIIVITVIIQSTAVEDMESGNLGIVSREA